ncbi:MAG: hypothetical protein PHY43_14205 [Verrucomicrobiales bacterium]|nr:hypothetical protein [Verrucomicrobiales bacterium]
MFQKAELERLQKQKDLLVQQSDASRLMLAADWQRLRSPENWLNEAGNLARRHPLWTAALAAAAGMLVVKAVRKPGSMFGGLGRLGELASLAFSVWQMIRGRKPGE